MMLRSVVVLLCLLLGGALAQPAPAFLDAVSAARASGEPAHPDQPAWRSAIRAGEQARAAAPADTATVRLLAELYSEVAWYARAYETWLDYASLSGDAPETAAFSEAAHQLGFARWRSGDAAGALDIYDTLLGFQPDNASALYWAARIRLESGEGDEAGELFGRLLDLDHSGIPADQLQLADDVALYGPEAALAFARGITYYELGQLEPALGQFEAAFEADRTFTDAAVWSGRTALELGDPGLATGYWRWATELDPADERSRYFLDLAERQERWGIPAVAAFDRGQELYAAGELPAALEAFEEAARLSPGYTEALRWSARVAQETLQYAAAADYWERVLSLEPGDAGASYFLNVAEQRLAFGADASDAFLRGLDLYRAAEFTAAEAEFSAVTEESPDFAPAWGYLGQIRFARGEYAAAATAFETARSLEPDNEEYVFFAMEAGRLAATSD